MMPTFTCVTHPCETCPYFSLTSSLCPSPSLHQLTHPDHHLAPWHCQELLYLWFPKHLTASEKYKPIVLFNFFPSELTSSWKAWFKPFSYLIWFCFCTWANLPLYLCLLPSCNKAPFSEKVNFRFRASTPHETPVGEIVISPDPISNSLCRKVK